jgi:hypothetical protein
MTPRTHTKIPKSTIASDSKNEMTALALPS